MEDKSKNRITVTIMGEEYTIRGSASPETMQKVARYVDDLMGALAHKNGHMSRHKIAVLTAINLADELLKLKQGFRQFSDDLRERGDEDELV
ncbi:MAG: cell division protein ZapA [Bacillota bacterium]